MRVLDDDVLRATGIATADLERVEAHERVELASRIDRLRPRHRRLDLTGKTALIVDDGIATGSTARAACLVARHLGARRVVVAAPVAAPGAVSRLTDADDVVCVAVPRGFGSVGSFYRDFSATSDEEVVALLDAARATRAGGARTTRTCTSRSAASGSRVTCASRRRRVGSSCSPMAAAAAGTAPATSTWRGCCRMRRSGPC